MKAGVFEKTIKRIKDKYKSYEKERNMDDVEDENTIDIALACDLADSVPFLLKSLDRPRKQMVNLSFYKTTGKWYTNGTMVTDHFIFEDGFLQDLVNTQTALVKGWNEHGDYYVVTSAPEEVNGFYNALWMPGRFKDLYKE